MPRRLLLCILVIFIQFLGVDSDVFATQKTELAQIRIANLSCGELSALGEGIEKTLQEELNTGKFEKIMILDAQQLALEAKLVGGLFKGPVGGLFKSFAKSGFIDVKPPENVLSLTLQEELVIMGISTLSGNILETFFGPGGSLIAKAGTELGKRLNYWRMKKIMGDVGYAEINKQELGIMSIVYDKKMKVAWVAVDLEGQKEKESIFMYVPFKPKPPDLKKTDESYDYKVAIRVKSAPPVAIVSPSPYVDFTSVTEQIKEEVAQQKQVQLTKMATPLPQEVSFGGLSIGITNIVRESEKNCDKFRL